jgi:phosphotransferase system enzyme I (PtsI)
VDRTDDRVSGLYEPRHPAILRTVRLVARAGRRAGIPVAVCGEMAADPVLLALLVGLGLREFSMAPMALPLAKQVVRSMRVPDARTAARRALAARTVDEVEASLKELLAPAAHTGR